MDILTLARELREAADLVVADKDGRSLLLVEVYPNPKFESEHLAKLRDDHQKFGFPFAMFANPNQIWLFGPDGSRESIAQFSTAETLAPYQSRDVDRRYFSSEDLYYPMSHWLDDFIDNHNVDRPPHRCCLQKVGLTDRLFGGFLMFEGMLFQPERGLERFF